MTEFDHGVDALLAFPLERQPATGLPPHQALQPGEAVPDEARSGEAVPGDAVSDDTSPAAAPRARRAWPLVMVGVLLATTGLVGFELARTWWVDAPLGATAGDLTVDTQPAGAGVAVDGQRRGVTPLTLSLEPGNHTVSVQIGASEVSRPVTIAAGQHVSQYFELVAEAPAASAPAAATISVVTDPAGARVSIDGQVRGVSPLTLTDLAAGEHTVVAQGATGRASRVVSVEPGATASVTFTLAAEAAPAGGWLALTSPFEVRVFVGDEAVGTSATSRIMLASGRHEVRLVSAALEYSEIVPVDIIAGQLTTLTVDPPPVDLNVNAEPWADVTIDDAGVGQTPIANVPVALGTHQLVFRHPQFGERRQTIVVTAKGPHRISMDMTR